MGARGRVSRRAALALLAAFWLVDGRPARADEVAVPVPLQMELLTKVAAYDKNLPARAGNRVRVLIVKKSGDDVAERTAEQAKKELQKKDTVAGLPLDASVVAFSDAKELAKQIEAKHIAVTYLTPGFSSEELAALAKSLDGVSVLSAGAVPKQVPGGIVLGFDLVGGKPKLLVHLERAKKQSVELSPGCASRQVATAPGAKK